jgi:hypothetical protein
MIAALHSLEQIEREMSGTVNAEELQTVQIDEDVEETKLLHQGFLEAFSV